MNKIKIKKIFETLINNYNYNSKIELKYDNAYTLLVAVILSARNTDKGVNKVTKELFKVVKTPEEMLLLGENKLREYIKTIGLCNTKAKHIIAMSEKLVKNFNSIVPDNMEDLTSLDGVGRKTANIILNIVYKKPSIAVDTHVFRVSNRIGFTKAKNVIESEKQLLKAIPKEYISEVNSCLVLHGRYVCKSRKPDCESCAIKDLCEKRVK